MRRLPTARQGYPWRGGSPWLYATGRPTPGLPHRRPAKPQALELLEAKARRLLKRRLMLERPELHNHHNHHHPNPTIAAVWAYVIDHEPAPLALLAEAAPFDRWVAAAAMPSIEAAIKPHQWGHQARADDMRRVLELEPRAPRGW